MNNIMGVDEQYRKWISEISKRFRQSQIRASVKVNDEMLRFYWQLGKDLHDKKKNFSYGQRFYKTVSSDLRKELPDVKSFSETNLKYMQYFYEMYPQAGNSTRVEEFSEAEKRPQLVENFKVANHPQPADDFGDGIIFSIPWGHQRVILDRNRLNGKFYRYAVLPHKTSLLCGC